MADLTKTNGNVNRADTEPSRDVPSDLTGGLTADAMVLSALAELDPPAEGETPKPTDPKAAAPEIDLTEPEEDDEDDQPMQIEDEVVTPEPAKPDASAKEEIEVTDGDGKKKITIDYSDRAATKRAYEQAAGVSKLYPRYVAIRGELAEATKKLSAKSESEANYEKLSSAFGDGGPTGTLKLLDALTGGKGADMAKQIAAAAPAASADGTPPKAADEVTQLRLELNQIKTAGQLSSAQSAIDTVFPEFSFAGKLGDASAENDLDATIFARLQMDVHELETQGKQITADVVRTLLSKSQALPKAVHKMAGRLVAKEKKKTAKAALKAAQAAATPGAPTPGGAEDKKPSTEAEINWLNPQDITKFLEQNLN